MFSILSSECNSFIFISSLGVVVCIRLQWPAKLPVTVWSRWPTHPRERSYCQQHPPDYQVHHILLKVRSMFFKFYTQALMWTSDLFLPDTSVMLLFHVLRSCNRSLEVEDTDEGSTSPPSSCPPSTSRNNSFRDRCRNQSVIIFLLLFYPFIYPSILCNIRSQRTLIDKMSNVCLF